MNTDGSPLLDLAGFRIHVGRSSGAYEAIVDVAARLDHTFTTLSPGRYYFAVEAYNASGLSSTLSQEVFADIP